MAEIGTGLPGTKITFEEKVNTFIQRLSRGMVAVMFVDAGFTSPTVVVATDAEDVAAAVEGLPEEQKTVVSAEMTRALDNGAAKVLALCAADVSGVNTLAAAQRFNWLSIGELEPADQTTVVTWAEGKGFRTGRSFMLMGDHAVLDDASDTTWNTVAFDDTNVTNSETTTAGLCGIFAGLSRRSGTYQVVDTKTDGTGYATMEQAADAINKGLLTVFYDGEKAKIGRAVTTYFDPDKPKKAMGKIRAVDAANMIQDDINDTFVDTYIGNSDNGYDDKMAFIGIVNQNYLAGLEGDVLNPEGENKVDIDVEMHRKLAKEAGEDVSKMSDMELRQYETGDVVYLVGSLRFMKTMEDLNIRFTVG